MDIKEKRILFIDLDGTLIRTIVGEKFAEDCTDFRIRKEVLDKIRTMESLEYVCIVTNQGGVPQYVSLQDFTAKLDCVTSFMFTYLNPDKRNYNVDVDATACFSMDPDDPNRKPNPGMLQRYVDAKLQFATARLKSKENMLMVGDASGKDGDHADSDKKCAENFGIDYMDVEEFLMA